MKLPFDETYCLCFAESEDRINNVNSVLTSCGLLDEVKVRYTVRHPYDLYIIKYLKKKNHYNWNGEGNGGAFGCTMEHYTIVKQALMRGLNSLLVIEDDMIIDNTEDIGDIFKSLPEDYDIIRYCFADENKYKNGTKQYIPFSGHKAWGTCCYALSRKGMRYYVEYMDKNYGVADLPFYDTEEIKSKGLNYYIYDGYEIRDGNIKSSIQTDTLKFIPTKYEFNIPKIIHYCWLSDEPISEDYSKYMETWSKLEGYTFNKLDKDSFDINSSKFVKTAYEKKAYAFASDYIRLWALYNYGGIYFDCDVSVIKDFSELLDRPYMLCIENERWDNLEAGVMGFAPKSPILKYVLDWYDTVEFSKDIEVLPVILKRLITKGLMKNIKKISSKDEWSYSDEVINVYTKDFFSPKGIYDGVIRQTDNTYTIHNFNANWLNDFGGKNRIVPSFPIKTLHTIWLGDKPIEDTYFESQDKYIHGFNRVIWNENNFIYNKCDYYDMMMERKEYAFASDYVRFKLLYEYGGLYMDTDVECIKEFPEEMFNNTFFGTEKYTNRVATGLIMYFKEPRCPILRHVVDTYESYRGSKPLIDGEILARSLLRYGYQNIDKTQKLNNDAIVYDSSYFCPKNIKTKELDIKDNTLTIHWYDR